MWQQALAQYGLAGLMLLMAFVAVGTGWIVPRWLYRERVRALEKALEKTEAALALREDHIATLMARGQASSSTVVDSVRGSAL